MHCSGQTGRLEVWSVRQSAPADVAYGLEPSWQSLREIAYERRVRLAIWAPTHTDGDFVLKPLCVILEKWLRKRSSPRRGASRRRASHPTTTERPHTAALKAGGASDGPPGPRPHYYEWYYAAFIRDPDGNRIEAVTFLSKAE
jgi:hypothetical protein